MTAPVIRVPFGRPPLGRPEADAVARVVRSRWVVQGPEVASFENELGAAVGAPHAVAVSSGTAAVELALRALGVGAGDEVITVSHGFIATANAVVAVGAMPVFVDVEPDTFGMDPAALPGALSPRTKAILCAHQIGFPCDLGGILPFARTHGVPVIEDAAGALGSEIQVDAGGPWERLGRPHGVLACFSFHPRTVITTGDGGMLTTTDGALAARLRTLRQHATTVPADARERDPLAREQYTEPAYNVRMTDLEAALGRPQLARLEAFLGDRRRLANTFAQDLAEHPVLVAPAERGNTRANWQAFPARLRPEGGLTQDQLLRYFLDRGIVCHRGLTNAHQEPAYAGRDNWRGGPLPVSEALRENVVMLPLFHGMTRDEERLVRRAIADLRDSRARTPYM